MSYRRLLYSLVLYLIFPFVILRLFWQSRKNRAYRQRISERLGFFKLSNKQPIIWVHAVSVGETIAAKPLIDRLISDYPDHHILVTSTTPTGSAMVKKLFGDSVLHVYFPYDLPEIVFRFLNRVKPQILIIVETEIWPNLVAACKKRKIPMMLANARLSSRSTKSYLKIKGLIEETLQRLDVIAVRSQEDGARFKQLGALDRQLIVAGNIKFDLTLNKKQIEKGRLRKEQWGNDRLVWVAASTHAGEESEILKTHSRLLQKYPDCLLILIPRHLERFDDVFGLCKEHNEVKSEVQGNSNTVRHSQQSDYTNFHGNIIVGDTIGEMQSWYAIADVVFMGGSLVDTGGHNPLEALALGKPVVSGSQVFNFQDIYPVLTKAGVCWVCEDADQIERQLLVLLENKNHASEFFQSATSVMRQYAGVTERLMGQVKCLM